jgi:glycosyltransferase involved in cell wall biosynthesis
LKILFPIGTLYPSQAGGPSNTVYWMAKALVAEGAEVTCMATNHGAEQEVEADRWRSASFGRVIYFRARFHQFPVKMMLAAAKQIKHHDCIHLNSLFYPPSFILAAIATWKKKAVLWSCRGNLDEAALRFSRWKKMPLLWIIKKLFAGPGTTFHATSSVESAHIKRHFGPNVRLVEVPNYMELPVPIPRQVQMPYLLYVGRIHPVKAIDHLIKAVSMSQTFLRSAFELWLAGADNNAHAVELKKLVGRLGLENRIRFIGHVEGDAKQALYANAYFSILPSHTENFGNVVIESLAQGTPVIASKGTPWEVLEKNKAGFWVENDPESLAKAIDRCIMLSPEEYSDCRNHAHQIAKRQFDVFENIHRWFEIYRVAMNPIQRC